MLRLSGLLTSLRLSLLLTCLAVPPLSARGQSADDCGETDEAKSGLCGHALAQIARMEALATMDQQQLQAAMEAQADTDITHCLLDIEIDTTSSPKSIAGSNTLEVVSAASGLSQMTLDLRSNMTVDGVTVNGTTAVYTRPSHQIVVNLDRAYDFGEAFQVKVAYHGSPLNRTDFFSSPQYFFSTHNGVTIASTLSQPFQANYWWPCKENWSDIDDKFTLDLHVTVPDTMVVAANGLLQGVDDLSGDRKKYRWLESYPIATYLVAFGATNYAKKTYTYNYDGGSMPVEFYYYPEQVPPTSNLNVIMEALGVYSSLDAYGQYPFINEKYGIMQFSWCCGMEHQTITSQGNYLTERRNIHELAHMWWGDSITCKTWHDVWLNEGFGRYSEALFAERRSGGSHAGYLATLNASRPSTVGTGTVYRYDISSSSEIFSTEYSYNKGAWVVHMLRHVLGDSVFFNALAAYRGDFDYGVADTEDFRAVCERVSGRDLGWFFDEWIYNPGAPFFRYGWQQERIEGKSYLRLHIEQYQSTLSSELPNMKMPIDVTIGSDEGSNTISVVNDARGRAGAVTQWYLLPMVGDPVTAVTLDKDTWILRGDPVKTTYVPGPPKVLDASVVTNRLQVRIQFSEAVAWTASDFTLVGSGTGSQAFTAMASPGDCSLGLVLPQPLDMTQTWTLTISDNVRSRDTGIQLDGENTGSLPSGDGFPGGSAVLGLAVAPPGPCDFDHDSDVDITDADHFMDCLSGANTVQVDPTCWNVDLDGDEDVDITDFGILQLCLSGTGTPASASCRD